jgi:hypothetical protein
MAWLVYTGYFIEALRVSNYDSHGLTSYRIGVDGARCTGMPFLMLGQVIFYVVTKEALTFTRNNNY